MSSSLYWRPVPKPAEIRLGYALKSYIANTLWGHDGSLNGEWIVFASHDWQSYLQGLHDATADEDLRQEIERVFELWAEHDGEIEISLSS